MIYLEYLLKAAALYYMLLIFAQYIKKSLSDTNLWLGIPLHTYLWSNDHFLQSLWAVKSKDLHVPCLSVYLCMCVFMCESSDCDLLNKKRVFSIQLSLLQ